MNSRDTLSERVEQILETESESSGLQSALDAIADHFEAQTSTLHRARQKVLHMVACRGIPKQIRDATREIPFGKGMAGLCAVREAPVTVCNLQTDSTGVARPAARETGVAGAIVVPIFHRDGDRRDVIGTLGVGKAGEHEYSEKERQTLAACAGVLAKHL